MMLLSVSNLLTRAGLELALYHLSYAQKLMACYGGAE